MPGVDAVSLRGERTPEPPMRMKTFRCPQDLWDYISDAAKENGCDEADIIRDALALDRDVAEKLKADGQRLGGFAAAHSLSMQNDLAEVLARLVRRGLDAFDREKKSKR